MPNLADLPSLERLRFGSMLPREILILKAWLTDHARDYDRIELDVKVGTGTDPGPLYSAADRKMWTALTRKRMDAVLWKGQAPTIVEVKDRADGSAIGQLLLYGTLWPQTFPGTLKPTLLLLCASTQSDLTAALATAQITLEILPVSFQSLY